MSIKTRDCRHPQPPVHHNFPESDNALRLARLRELIRNRQELRRLFDEIFDREMAANG